LDKLFNIFLIKNTTSAGSERIGDTNSMPIPREGERLYVNGKHYKVLFVAYNLDTAEIYIYVE
jgi:hypothetical protein